MAIKNYASNLTHRIGCCSARPPSRRAGMNMSRWLMSRKNKRGFRWQKKNSERRTAIVLRARIRRAWGDVRAITIKAASIFAIIHRALGMRARNARNECPSVYKITIRGKEDSNPLHPSFPPAPFVPLFSHAQAKRRSFFPAAELFPRWRVGWFIGP